MSLHAEDILGMCLIGNILVSYDAHRICVTDIKSRASVGDIQLLQPAQITALVHPSTYVNKVVVGYSNGALELWNVVKQKLIHTFTSHTEYLDQLVVEDSIPFPAITVLEQSPALDIIAIGFASGLILLLNMKTDQVLFHFSQDEGVTSLSFRLDAVSEKFPYLVSGGSEGRVHIWNLGDGSEDSPRRLQETLEEAHCGRVLRVQFLHGEPIMVTSGTDNAMKVQ
jgi:U3 small nucleolar RNA-associated protein 21